MSDSEHDPIVGFGICAKAVIDLFRQQQQDIQKVLLDVDAVVQVTGELKPQYQEVRESIRGIYTERFKKIDDALSELGKSVDRVVSALSR
jgi:hypothetical protein